MDYDYQRFKYQNENKGLTPGQMQHSYDTEKMWKGVGKSLDKASKSDSKDSSFPPGLILILVILPPGLIVAYFPSLKLRHEFRKKNKQKELLKSSYYRHYTQSDSKPLP